MPDDIPQLGMWNFITEQHEVPVHFPETDEEAYQYLPQDYAIRAIYAINRKQGMSIAEAMLDCFDRMTRKVENIPVLQQKQPLFQWLWKRGK